MADFEKIYHEDVINALKNDNQLNFKPNQQGTYLTGGKCPQCGQKEVYISLEKPYRLACSRLGKCQWTQNTRDRYSELFECLSDKYPATAQNPNAAADAYLSAVRGFTLDKLKGLYQQGQIKIADGSLAEAIQFKLNGGHWSRLIDAKSIKANKNRKAMIDKGLRYQGQGWIFPSQRFNKGATVFIVEGIFHAIALHLKGYDVIAAISCNNLPSDLIQANKDKAITWVLAYDNDDAGRQQIIKYYKQLVENEYTVRVALTEGKEDWDDVYKAGQLTEAYMDKAFYRGSLLSARSKEWKAYFIYEETKQGFYLIDFNHHLYSIKVDVTEYHKELNNDENHDGDFETFKRHVSINQICNCIPVFKYIQRDSITGEQQYFFNFLFPNKALNCTEPLPPSSIASARAFSQAILERTPGGNFEATDKVLGMLRGEWLREVKTVKTLSFIGYDEESSIYCYQHFGYKSGQKLSVNKEGFIEAGNDFIKTSLKSSEVIENKEPFNLHWFTLFNKVHDLNGLATLAWWTGSLFTQQIKKRQSCWPFLELTGDAGAGKSTLLRFLWQLLGRANREGTKPGDGASKVGLRREMSQVSNMPVVLIEADKEQINSQGKLIIQQYPWDEFKDLFDYNGVLRSTGVKNNGNDTNELIFKGSLCISQNNSVDGSEAILTRIVHLHATRDHHQKELKKIADQLNGLTTEFLAGYLEHVLQHENQWLEVYFQAFPRYEKYLQEVELIKHQRIVLTHAQVMAATVATQTLFKAWNDDLLKAVLNHLKQRAIRRQQRISREPDALSKFWDIYHYLNEKHYQQTDEQGELIDQMSTEKLNHSQNPTEEIAINVEHFIMIANNYKLYVDSDIHKLFSKSTTYPLICNKNVRSRIEKRVMKCWVFSKSARNDVK